MKRQRWLLAMVAGALTAGALTSGTPALGAPVTEWTQYRHDAAHTGNNATERVLSPSSVGRLTRDWAIRIPARYGPSSPAVAGGKVFLTDGDYEQSTLYALNAATGSRLWSVLGGPESDPKGPAVSADLVFTMGSRRLEARRVADGSRRWQGQAPGTLPAVAGGLVFHQATTTGFYATSVATGRIVWGGNTGGQVSTPIVGEGRLYYGFRYSETRARDQQTGAPRWDKPHGTPLAVAGGVLLTLPNFDGSVLRAVDAGTGAARWTVTVGGKASNNLAGVAIDAARGIVTATLHSGSLHALRLSDGQPLWSVSLGGVISSPPSIANGVVFAGDGGSAVRAYDARTGRLLWKGEIGGSAGSDPVIADGALYIVDGDDTLIRWTLPERR